MANPTTDKDKQHVVRAIRHALNEVRKGVTSEGTYVVGETVPLEDGTAARIEVELRYLMMGAARIVRLKPRRP